MDNVICGTRVHCIQGAPVARFSDFFVANILFNSPVEGSSRVKVCTSAGWYEYRSVYIHATGGIRTYGPSIRCVKDDTRHSAVRCDQHNNIIISNVFIVTKQRKKKERNKNPKYAIWICDIPDVWSGRLGR